MRSCTWSLWVCAVVACGPPRNDAARDAGPPQPALGDGEPAPFASAEDEAFANALTSHRQDVHTLDWEGIQKRGALRVITRNNSTGYFLYRGRETGFYLEVARMMAREWDVRLEMVVPGTRRDLIPFLLDGKGDIILTDLSTDVDRADRVAFSSTTLTSPWVVVMRKDAAQKVAAGGLDALAAVPLLVQASGGALRKLRQLGRDSGAPRWRVEAALESLEAEDLLDMVAEGTAAACVVPGRLAQVELASQPDLAVAMELPGETDEQAVAVRRDNPVLLGKVDAFLKKHHRGTEWNILYKRFHEPGERARAMRDEEWRADRTGAISPWDEQLQQAAREAGLDWRLLAAQAYQESRFKPDARSEAGAQGLMQLMPTTALSLGVKNPADPLESLQGGARYMGTLLRKFPPDFHLKDRVRLALASYNVGPSHVADARRLAEKMGLSTSRWFGHVEKAMKLLSKPRYYRQARFGFCRGEEPVRYVSEIQTRYDGYVAMTENRDRTGP